MNQNRPSELHPTPATVSTNETTKLAVDLHQRGYLDEAQELYEQVLKLAPRNADALHFLGVLSHQRGQLQVAVQRLRKALQIDPRYRDARLNLGNVLQEQGQFAEAETEYRAILDDNPDHVDTLNNLGSVLKRQRKFDEAIETYLLAIELRPDHADTFRNLGNARKAAGQLEEALTCYRKAIEIKPDHGEAYLDLGRALYRFDRVAEAATVFGKWIEVEPENPIAQHMLAACTGKDPPERASDAFIQQTFGGFAASFNEALGRLDYRAPGLVASALKAALPSPASQFNILDVGCGTGLCGQSIRPYAKHLVGIDLSRAMLEKARGLAIYDELVASELTDYMNRFPQSYDVIVSADTFVYFGSLAAVFTAAFRALRPSGCLTFTVEQAPNDKGAGFRLNPHGRYSHTQPYITQSLQDAGLSVHQITCDTLRNEALKPVPGLVVTAWKIA